jgi:hypothetical protein
MTTTLRSPRPADVPPAWIIDQQPAPSASIEPPRPWAERPSMPEWDEHEVLEEETAPTGGTVIIIDL